MLTTVPVADVAASSQGTSVPDIADGGGWTTEVLLVNTTDAVETGMVQFLSASGQKMNVTVSGQSGDQFSYSIPAHSSRRFKTSGGGSTPTSGWIEISPTGNTRPPSVTGVLAAKVNNVTVSETSVVGSTATNSVRLPAELSGNFSAGEPLSTQTGFVISNPGSASVNVTVEATNPDGTLKGTATPISVPARGQVGMLLGSVAGLSLSAPFTGTLWITAPAGSSIAVTGMRARYTDRQAPDLLFTAFPAVDEASVQPSLAVFPQIVGSGGYSTQFVMTGVRGGQSSGTLQFLSQAGQPLPLFIH